MQHSYKVPANILHNFSFCLYQRSGFWHLYPVMNFSYTLNTEYGGLRGYGWLTVFRQVQLSFVCLDNLGKINKSLKLSLWKLPFGKMAMFLLGKQWRFMSGGRVQPVEHSLPGVAFLSWNELNETSSSTLIVHVTLLPILRPLFQSFFLVKLWTEDTSFTQVLQSGLWWGGSAQHTCILLSDAQGLPLPCSALKVPVFSQASFPTRCSPNISENWRGFLVLLEFSPGVKSGHDEDRNHTIYCNREQRIINQVTDKQREPKGSWKYHASSNFRK